MGKPIRWGEIKQILAAHEIQDDAIIQIEIENNPMTDYKVINGCICRVEITDDDFFGPNTVTFYHADRPLDETMIEFTRTHNEENTT